MNQKELNNRLLLASCDGNDANVKESLRDGADIESKSIFNDTPLIYASHFGHAETVRLLLDMGADINAANDFSQNSMTYALANNHKESVIVLLENGIDIGIGGLLYTSNIWSKEDVQELIINKQPHNIKFFDDKIGIIPSLKLKYKDIIELSLMGLF